MGEWFKKEAGFRYRVDGNVGLHYLAGADSPGEMAKVMREAAEKHVRPASSRDQGDVMRNSILRFESYNTVEPGWSERNCWEDLPVEKLEVTLEWTDDDGERTSDSESMTIPDGWDFTEPSEYERMAKALCERNGIKYSECMWKD